MTGGLPLAPEALEGIRAAQEALEQQAARLAATGDPIAAVTAANAAVAKALNRLMVDVFLKVQDQAAATAGLIKEGRKPWSRDETRALVEQLDATLLHRWAAFNRAGIAIGVGVALAFGVACAGGGWWWHSRAAAPAAVTNCVPAPQPGGGEAFACTFWTRLPTPGKH